MTKTDLNRIARELRKIETQERTLAARKKELQDMVKNEMASSGNYEITGKDYRITWNMVNQTRFDTKAFSAVEPSLYEQFLLRTQSRRFVLV